MFELHPNRPSVSKTQNEKNTNLLINISPPYFVSAYISF
ncbi:hypothetical protein CHCC14821_1180 [Bacillus paralicheniformis]|nr:hypothetical protein CHCC14821_1180 [Bacillus paralicheniformis]